MGKLCAPDYAELSPYALLRDLPALAKNRVPPNLVPYCKASGLAAWQLLEEAVFYFFRQVLMLETIRLGADSLFKHEPEGIVLVNRDPEPFALMYECKARARSYLMSSDDILRYKDYIKRKKSEVKERHHLALTQFIVVSSGFRGDLNKRVSKIESEGVTPCFASAEYMRLAYVMIRSLDFPDLRLLDLRSLFPRGVAKLTDMRRCFPAIATS